MSHLGRLIDIGVLDVWGWMFVFSTDLLIILSNFVATDVYALFKKSIKKNCNMMFKTKGGGGGQRLFEQCSKKNCRFGRGGHPLALDGRKINIDISAEKQISVLGKVNLCPEKSNVCV